MAQATEIDVAEGPEVNIAMLLRIGPVGEEATRAENARGAGGNKGKFAKMAYETLQMLQAGGFHEFASRSGLGVLGGSRPPLPSNPPSYVPGNPPAPRLTPRNV